MRKISTLTKGTLVTGAAFAAALALAASPASAAGTWSVAGGGSITAVSTNTLLTDTSTGVQLKCVTSDATGSAADGTGLAGDGLASITGVTWDSCTGPLNIQFDVTADNTPWQINATSYSNGVTTGTLTGVEANTSGLGCTADFGGASAGTPATLDVTYTNATHTLTLLGTGDLHAYNVSGTCLGLLNSGDPASYVGDYVVSPSTLTITSP